MGYHVQGGLSWVMYGPIFNGFREGTTPFPADGRHQGQHSKSKAPCSWGKRPPVKQCGLGAWKEWSPQWCPCMGSTGNVSGIRIKCIGRWNYRGMKMKLFPINSFSCPSCWQLIYASDVLLVPIMVGPNINFFELLGFAWMRTTSGWLHSHQENMIYSIYVLYFDLFFVFFGGGIRRV